MRKTVFDCVDCGIDTKKEYYMVYDKIWNFTGLGFYNNKMLCLNCLEKRIGRSLTKNDFPDCPANWMDTTYKKSKKFIDIIT